MPRPLRTPVAPISYTITDAAEAIGVSETTIKDALRNGHIDGHYITPQKRVILHDDLRNWVASQPTERP